MAITFEQIIEANKEIKTMPIERKDKKTGNTISKDYAVVNERIKAFRMLFPEGSIVTTLISDDGEKCIFRAEIINEGKTLGTGTAFELKTSSFINNSSYIENCETSAVGRALAMCGIGIDVSVASYEEVANAQLNQSTDKIDDAIKAAGSPTISVMKECLLKHYPNGSDAQKQLLESFQKGSVDELTKTQLLVIWNKYKGK